MHGALGKIAFTVGLSARSADPETVIGRFLQELDPPGEYLTMRRMVINIVGLIQGLVDNVVTHACYALNQLVVGGLAEDAARLDIPELVEKIRAIHRLDAPSPFLPRRLNPMDIDKGFPDVANANVVCAVGAALEDGEPDDIRLGWGMHQCIGLEIGDQLAAKTLKPLLECGPLSVVAPLRKQWGWIVEQLGVASSGTRRQSQSEILRTARGAPARPHPLSLWSATDRGVSSYTSWPSLVDRSYFSRHLPPASQAQMDALPENDADETGVGPVTRDLFTREAFDDSRSSVLFTFFAQWFTDSFLRTDPRDRRRNTSTHNVDMCQIYGLRESTAQILRAGAGGRLKTESTLMDEFPPLLYDEANEVKVQFRQLPFVASGQLAEIVAKLENFEAKRPFYFASGLERGNSSCGYTALSTLFLREHNRLCGVLADNNPGWSDERLFQTARMVVTAICLKIVVEQYINHIHSRPDEPQVFELDTVFAEYQDWYRTNWIAIEFDLLYRWHALVPDALSFGGRAYQPREFLGNNEPLVRAGLEQVLIDASSQPAGRIGLLNSPKFLLPAEHAAMVKSRAARVRPLNDYREYFGLPRVRTFEDFDEAVAGKLEEHYGDVDAVELIPGLLAESTVSSRLFGPTMTVMVAHDAFTQALTNPLLARRVFHEGTFTSEGMEAIASTSSLADVAARNGVRNPEGVTFDF